MRERKTVHLTLFLDTEIDRSEVGREIGVVHTHTRGGDSKVKGGNKRTNNTESTDRGARGKEGPIKRGEWREGEQQNNLNTVLC